VLAANNFFLMVLATMGYKFGHAILNRLREDGDFLVSFLISFLSTTSEHGHGDVKEDEEMEIFSITRY
jgi:hypothetical protein